VIAALRGAAEEVPLLLVLDDPHWLDEPSLRLLAALGVGPCGAEAESREWYWSL
jgi:hypothetical protein